MAERLVTSKVPSKVGADPSTSYCVALLLFLTAIAFNPFGSGHDRTLRAGGGVMHTCTGEFVCVRGRALSSRAEN